MSNRVESDMDIGECPLCVEQFDYDDFDFFPCPCGYQICRFCWHKLINQEDKKGSKGGRGLCPACRQEYPESPARFNSSLTIEAVEELVKNKKKKKRAMKAKAGDKVGPVNNVKKEERNLSGLRVVQKNLVFVIGIPMRLSQEDLRREFSKYGKIHKLAVGHNNNSTVNSVYVTYSRPEDAIKAIQALNHHNNGNNHIIMNGLRDGKSKNGANIMLKASLGTTKYCTHWLKNQQCPKLPDCMYLHELAEPEASFTKEEMQQGKHTEYEKKLISQYLKEKGANKSNINALNTRRNGAGHKNNRNGVGDGGGGSGFKSDSDGEGCENNSERMDKTLSMDDLVGVSSDSSTSFSTCSSSSGGGGKSNDGVIKDGSETFVSGYSNSNSSVGLSNEDDDGLDFDPITVSTTGLQDLIANCRDSLNTPCAPQDHLCRNSIKLLLPNRMTMMNGGYYKPGSYGMMRPEMYPWYNGVNPNTLFNGGINGSSLMLNGFMGQPMGSKQPPPGFANF